MFQDLLPFLIALVLPILILLVMGLYNELSAKDISKDSKAAQLLEELIDEMPKFCLNKCGERTIHEVTHFKDEDAYFFDGSREEKIFESWKKSASNNFIKYSDDQWVNSHWIESIEPGRLEMYNGAVIFRSTHS